MSEGNNGDGEGYNPLYWIVVFLIAFFLFGAFIMSVGN